MCGIVGIVNISKSSKPFNSKTLEDIRSAMVVQKHRGPDDQGVCSFNFNNSESHSAANALELNNGNQMDGIIGFNRLSIRDLSMAGHQPMTAVEGKVILAFNGEIYNNPELKSELEKKGYSFKGTSDTEVVLGLYLEYGFEKMLNKLNGMFAIVIVDLRVGNIYIARDRFGIKPLYYTFYKGRFAFASEIKSIIQFSDFEREPDMNAFNSRLVFSRPSNKVLLSGVEMLEPGQAVKISQHGETRFWTYFDINDYERNEGEYNNIEEAIHAAQEVLSNSVSRQTISDVKVGCQLSGGIDSTIVSNYATTRDGVRLKDGVSIVDDAGALGEEFYIDHVGSALELNVHKFKLEPEYFLENYQRMIWHNDAPVYKPYFVCFLMLTERAKEHVTVLLSGEGADELAGGYGRFAAGIFQPFLSKLGGNIDNLKSYKSYAEYAVMSDTTLTNLLTTGWENLDDLISEQVEVFNSFSGSNFTKQIKFEMTQRLPESLMRQDKMSMANSIENRVPLLDNEVVDFMMQLPEEYLVQFTDSSPLKMSENPFEWASGKYLLKELCARKFGYDFAYRKKKIMVLNERTMLSSTGFEEHFHDLIYPKMKDRGLIDANLIRDWYESLMDIDDRTFTSMWRAISLETWCQLFLDSKGEIHS